MNDMNKNFFDDIMETLYCTWFIWLPFLFVLIYTCIIVFFSCDCTDKVDFINSQIVQYERDISKQPTSIEEMVKKNYLKEDIKCETGKHIFIIENGKALIAEDKTEEIKKEENYKQCKKKSEFVTKQVDIFKNNLPKESIYKENLIKYRYLNYADFECDSDYSIDIYDGQVTVKENNFLFQ